MRVATVLGTRPEIIRLSRIIPRLDGLCTHRVVHTGQNAAPGLSDIFFRELGVRAPDIMLGVATTSMAQQVAAILVGVEQAWQAERPDRVLVLGDTNSALAAIVAKRMGIPVFHMEAGNRCYDDRVPEEVNRRIVDHCSDVLMPYTERSRANLLREGLPGHRIFVTGNPIFEVLEHHGPEIRASTALDLLGVEPRRFILVTLHRAENVDVPERLSRFVAAFGALAERHGVPVIVSTHPRTRQKLDRDGVEAPTGVRFVDPFGLFDFVRLEQEALAVLTDSGTVQEECAILGVPNVTLRDVTERPETLEQGSNMLTGSDPVAIARAVEVALRHGGRWRAPPEYLMPAVSDTVVRLVLGHHLGLGPAAS